MFVMILLDRDDKPFRVIGQFEDEDSPLEWLKENGVNCRYQVLPLEAHGWIEQPDD